MTEYHTNDAVPQLNYDETMAERLASLALLFMNTRHPVTSEYILQTLYYDHDNYDGNHEPNLKDIETAKKTFSRDRKRLATCGIHIHSVTLSDGTNAYQVDEQSSFAESGVLSTRDAFVLDMVCQPLLNDPSFPYAADLRLALAKIDRSFQSSSALTAQRTFEKQAQQNHLTKAASIVRSSYMALHACHIVYSDAHGVASERDIAPFGIFGLRNSIYVVAASVENKQINAEKMRTFNLARILKARELSSISFQIPVDFDLQEFVRLPFQIGPVRYDGAFLVPDRFESDLRQIVGSSGVFSPSEKGLVLKTAISSEKDAARWSIAWNLIPLEPSSLVATWRKIVRAACDV